MVKGIKERLKYYVPVYLCGFCISIWVTGVPQWYYLLPVKLIPLCFMMIAGNCLYNISVKKMPLYAVKLLILKYIFVSMLLLFIFALFYQLLLTYSIDISPLIGV